MRADNVRIPERNQVPGHPHWLCGLIVLRSDGSLLGHRRMTVYGPNGEQFDVESSEGTAALKHEAARVIDERFAESGVSTLYSVCVVLLGFATVGAALRYGGWARLALVLAAIALVATALRQDARPPIRRD